MKIIDTHVHVFPDKLEPHAIATLSVPERTAKIHGTVEGCIERMQRLNIAQGWTVPVATKASQVDTINKFAATQDRNFFVPFGAIHPDTLDPRETLSHFREIGLAGFKIHPDYQDLRPTDPRMEAIYTAASDFGLIAYFHAGDDVGPRTLYGNPDEFVQVIESYPKMKLVLAHLGGYRVWDEVEEKLVGRDVFFDTAYTYTQMPDEQLLRIIKNHGTNKVLFGSDSPWTRIEDDIAFFAGTDVLAGDEKEALFHGNAENLLASVGY
jgi:predicted TIM-barrel fold metal-dependent hydrolase